MSALPRLRYWRRLLFAVLGLSAVDAFVPGRLAALEAVRYESNRLFRFEASDLFALGPLVGYLQEHPRGARPRIAFFGDSVVWGYLLRAPETLPAQFQTLRPDARVLNLAINGLDTASAYLIAKDIVDALDMLYVFDFGRHPNTRLPELVPVETADVEQFRLTPPSRVERRLEGALGGWHLYTNSYRLQAALFGTSTRIYVYLHKGALARQLLGRPVEAAVPAPAPAPVPDVAAAAATIVVDARLSPEQPSLDRQRALRQRHPLLWAAAELVRGHGKHAAFIEVAGHAAAMSDEDRADLNAVFAPHVRVVAVDVPAALKFDKTHLTALGSAALAQVLARDVPPQFGGRP
ncbi:MAG: hypothetical protein ABUS56_09180 [Acidobacteriota bacterium]